MFCAVVEVCTISLAEFTMLWARFVGSITAHCALLVPHINSRRANKIVTFFFMFLSPFFCQQIAAVIITGKQSVITEQQNLAAAEIPDTSRILVPVKEQVVTPTERNVDFSIALFSNEQGGLVSLEAVRHTVGFTDSQR